MKIAFICEGPSEYDSIVPILKQLGTSYFFLKQKEQEPPTEGLSIYRHNCHGLGGLTGTTSAGIRKFAVIANELIGDHKFDAVCVWFDNEGWQPVCEQAAQLRTEIKEQYGEEFSSKVVFCIANKYVENWFLSDVALTATLFGIDEAVVNEICGELVTEANVDTQKVGDKIKRLRRASGGIGMLSKPKLATRFFGVANFDADFRSHSLRRFTRKVRSLCAVSPSNSASSSPNLPVVTHAIT